MTLLAATLPENSHDGYVAAAYIVFFALILVYVAIMALRLRRMERRLTQMRGSGEKEQGRSGEDRESERHSEDRERELV